MASYAAFYLAGLYPVPATRQYLLSSPFFPSNSSLKSSTTPLTSKVTLPKEVHTRSIESLCSVSE